MGGGGVVFDVGSWRLGDDGTIHRRGRLKYPNGDVYEGEWVDGQRHGRGHLTVARDGATYLGGFVANRFEGFGLWTLPRRRHPLTRAWVPGVRYEGEFRGGLRHGNGTAWTPTGDVYHGAFVADHYDGQGRCVYANGDVYEGAWCHGQWHGRGELRRLGGPTYVGEFAQGLFDGVGRLTYGATGASASYTGDFRQGRRHGRGRRVFPDGQGTYDGAWADDEMHGVGVLETSAYRYVGEFVRGHREGHGVQAMANGDAYEGGFAAGAFAGRGVFRYRHEGGFYDGEFRDGKRHGRGRRVFAADETKNNKTKTKTMTLKTLEPQDRQHEDDDDGGHWYDGEWAEDAMHGHGILVKTTTIVGKKPPRGSGIAVYRYEGAFVEGQATGHAEIRYTFTPAATDEATVFEILDEYEFPVGSGCWHRGHGSSRYVGAVLRGSFHGHGELTSPDGRSWRGDWRYGRLHGRAEVVYMPVAAKRLREMDKLSAERRRELATQFVGLYKMVTYDGAFVEHVRQGHGRVLWENGDTVEGHFEGGLATGIVRYTFLSGRSRLAEYDKGQRRRWLSDQEEHEEMKRQEAASSSSTARREAVVDKQRGMVLQALTV